eukprot:COSAG05_NODE_833_length_7066_cov_45.021961_1_plen_189_part_10
MVQNHHNPYYFWPTHDKVTHTPLHIHVSDWTGRNKFSSWSFISSGIQKWFCLSATMAVDNVKSRVATALHPPGRLPSFESSRPEQHNQRSYMGQVPIGTNAVICGALSTCPTGFLPRKAINTRPAKIATSTSYFARVGQSIDILTSQRLRAWELCQRHQPTQPHKMCARPILGARETRTGHLSASVAPP